VLFRSIDAEGNLNPDSQTVLTGALVEPFAKEARDRARFQFIRQGYFALDGIDSGADSLVFNQIVQLKDSFAKTLVNV